MRILGVDPGIAILGWAIIEKNKTNLSLLACDAITTPSRDQEPTRLLTLYEEFSKILQTYSPDILSIEQLYFAANTKTALTVAQARGVVLLASAQHNLPIASYTPLEVKKIITGDGTADKQQIQWMIKTILPTATSLPKLDDITDAIAIALTHAYIKSFL